VALGAGEQYYARLASDYSARRAKLAALLETAGFGFHMPRGAYYVMTDISGFGFAGDLAFAQHMLENVGVIGVPGSSFYADPADGAQQMRFCFCKKAETLQAAGERLAKLRGADRVR
jgi:aminotransferase